MSQSLFKNVDYALVSSFENGLPNCETFSVMPVRSTSRKDVSSEFFFGLEKTLAIIPHDGFVAPNVLKSSQRAVARNSFPGPVTSISSFEGFEKNSKGRGGSLSNLTLVTFQSLLGSVRAMSAMSFFSHSARDLFCA